VKQVVKYAESNVYRILIQMGLKQLLHNFDLGYTVRKIKKTPEGQK
jgi:hypothetical protein